MNRILVGWVTVFLSFCLQQQTSGQGVVTNQLSFDEVVVTAILNNLSIKDQQLEWQISKWGLQREAYSFEPALTLSARRIENQRENSVEESLSQLSSFFEERNWAYSSAIEGVLPAGTRYNLGYNLSELSNNLTNFSNSVEFAPEFSSFLGVNLTQPLLQGAGRDAVLARFRLAAAQSDNDLHVLRKQVMTVVAVAGAAYWELVMAGEQLKIRKESVAIARKILADNIAREVGGKMSELDVLQARAGVALRETRENSARQAWVEAMNNLKRVFADSSTEHIEPADEPRISSRPLNYAESMEVAVRFNPDYLVALNAIEEENIRLQYAESQDWPQLDLEGSYGYNGLGSDVNDSWQDVVDSNYPSWTVGLVMRVGLGGGGASNAELEAARLRRRQALVRLKSSEVDVASNISTAIARVHALKENAKKYRVVTAYNEDLLEAELNILAQGKSDARKVLQVEEDLNESKISELESKVDYQESLLALRIVEGAILYDLDMDILEARPGQNLRGRTRDVDVQWPLVLGENPVADANLADTEIVRGEVKRESSSRLLAWLTKTDESGSEIRTGVPDGRLHESEEGDASLLKDMPAQRFRSKGQIMPPKTKDSLDSSTLLEKSGNGAGDQAGMILYKDMPASMFKRVGKIVPDEEGSDMGKIGADRKVGEGRIEAIGLPLKDRPAKWNTSRTKNSLSNANGSTAGNGRDDKKADGRTSVRKLNPLLPASR